MTRRWGADKGTKGARENMADTATISHTHPLSAVVSTPWHVLAFANGKGGVGKTSITANEAALFGRAGYRVLLVELDPQGNCARDFGLKVGEWETINDLIDSNGEAHAASLMMPGSPSAKPPLYKDVRPGVDLIAGGGALERIFKYFAANTKQNFAQALQSEILSLGTEYDLILIDAPPIDMTALDAVLQVAGTVIIPIRADDASIDGLSTIASHFGDAREVNPALRLGGVVRFGLGSRSTRVAGLVHETVEEIIGGAAPIFESIVRHSDAACFDGRRHGLLAYELETVSAEAASRKFEALRAGAERSKGAVATGAASSAGLAEDYERLGVEILQRINELVTEDR